MGELGAIHEDVRFDWGKASELAAELRATAGELDDQVTERNNIKTPAREHWEGRYAHEFDDRVSTCTSDASRFASSMREAARQLDELARLAREEQNRREQAREWERNNDDGGFWDSIGDFFFGEDDLPPPPPPVEPPTISIAESPGAREV
ncbi:MAG TPA: hypothetical protein VIL48_17265 [Acidimicrobiales bacterium]